MLDRRVMLRVKIKSLADEARTIRKEQDRLIYKDPRWAHPIEVTGTGSYSVMLHPNDRIRTFSNRSSFKRWLKTERRPKDFRWYQLREHRIGEVRKEQRASLIAYGFLRGLEFECIESHAVHKPNWDRVRTLVSKYGVYQTSDMSRDDFNTAYADQMKRFDDWSQEVDRKHTGKRSPDMAVAWP